MNTEADPPKIVWTIPNILCLIRLIGSPFLTLLGWAEFPVAFVVLYLFLMATDWIDGKLAIWLDQRSAYGAKLDTWADASMYGCLLIGIWPLAGEPLAQDWLWIAMALLSWSVAIGAGYFKFAVWPSYHTRSAKIAWLLILVGVMVLVVTGHQWPLRIALVAVTIANLESTAITTMLKHPAVDVPSIFAAKRLDRQHET